MSSWTGWLAGATLIHPYHFWLARCSTSHLKCEGVKALEMQETGLCSHAYQ